MTSRPVPLPLSLLFACLSSAAAAQPFAPGRLVELNRPPAPPAEKVVAIVGAGLTPAAVIVAATMEGARFLRTEQRFGSIEPGKLADLVLIDGNPLADIRVMRKIKRVMLNGRWIPHE